MWIITTRQRASTGAILAEAWAGVPWEFGTEAVVYHDGLYVENVARRRMGFWLRDGCYQEADAITELESLVAGPVVEPIWVPDVISLAHIAFTWPEWRRFITQQMGVPRAHLPLDGTFVDRLHAMRRLLSRLDPHRLRSELIQARGGYEARINRIFGGVS